MQIGLPGCRSRAALWSIREIEVALKGVTAWIARSTNGGPGGDVFPRA
jgi:hypothetical protein